MRLLLFLLLLLAAGRDASAFALLRDTFAFANDTAFAYGVDETGHLTMQRKEKEPEFSHRCFVLCRATLQFYKFAQFDPSQPRVSEQAYRALVRHVSRLPAWLPEKKPRLVLPGYRDLHDFSRGHEHLLKEELGLWFPTYLRIGNWRMVGPFPRWGQTLAVRKLCEKLDRGQLQAVYITRFPQMNHCLILFKYHRTAPGDVHFEAYDPNYPNQVGTLTYLASQQSFEFPKRWFWTGGRVNLMRVYLSPVH